MSRRNKWWLALLLCGAVGLATAPQAVHAARTTGAVTLVGRAPETTLPHRPQPTRPAQPRLPNAGNVAGWWLSVLGLEWLAALGLLTQVNRNRR